MGIKRGSNTNMIIRFHLTDRWAKQEAQVSCLVLNLAANYSVGGQEGMV